MGRTLTRIAHEILERNRGVEDLALVGIRTRGVPIARRLAKAIREINGHDIPTGALDITLYRDDLSSHTLGPQPLVRKTEIPFSIDGKLILLVGAAHDDLQKASPLLTSISSSILHFGDVGTGTAFKLINNLLGAVHIAIASLAEAVALATRLGLDRRTLIAAVDSGPCASPHVKRLIAPMAEARLSDTPALSIAALRTRARRLKRQRGLDVLVIDYIQLLQGSQRKANESRVQEVTEITTGLKALAKELNVPIVALSQLSRQVESRDDKRPQLSDLRESGSIEQDADVVLFVFREEYYLSNKEPRPGSEEHLKWQTEMALVHGKAEVIIGKQRHGPTGTVQLQFEAAVTRFGDLSPDDRMPERIGD
jgi:hypothetical protein